MTYQVHFINRRGPRVWVIPLAGTTITRRSMLVPAVRGLPPLELDYHNAIAVCDRLKQAMRDAGLPGIVSPQQTRDFTQAEIEAMQAAT